MEVVGRRNFGKLEAGAVQKQWLFGTRDCETWRLFRIATDRPLQGTLRWGSLLGPAPEVAFSIARSAKVCVFANTWELLLTNLDGSNAADVRVVVLDTHESVFPVFEEPAAEVNSPGRSHTIPSEVRFDTADQALAGALVELLDVDGTVRASITQTRLPPWIPLGSANSVRVTSAAPYRLVWRLQTV